MLEVSTDAGRLLSAVWRSHPRPGKLIDVTAWAMLSGLLAVALGAAAVAR